MPGSYSKRPAKSSKRRLSDRDLLRSAKQSADAHARNHAQLERVQAADRENRRNEP